MAGEQLLRVFDDPSIIELILNSDGSVYIERSQGLERLNMAIQPDEAAAFVKALVGETGFGPQRPYADLSARDGSRVHVLAPPLVKGGLAVTIRKRPVKRPTLEELVQNGTITLPAAQFLAFAAQERKNILVVGGTSSGKTTFLNSLCGLIADEDRVLVAEDTPELTLALPHVVYMKTRMRDPNGLPDVTLRDLVTNTLRMRPDRIVVGEVRGPEAWDMLQAMNLGQEGVMGTLHANSPREAVQRLETLILSAGMDMPLRAVRGNVAQAVDLIVFMARLSDGTRRVVQITEITGLEVDNVLMSDLFKLEGRKAEGGVSFHLRPTGSPPRFYDQLRDGGFEPPMEFFQE